MNRTNKQIILEHLMLGRIITTKQAMEVYGIADLQGVIRDLRNEFFDIRDRSVRGLNRRGRRVTYKEYYIDTNSIVA